MKQATNALFAVANNEQQNRALSQRDQALVFQERRDVREQESFDQERLQRDELRPYHALQVKIEHGLRFVPALTKMGYAGFKEWMEKPVTQDGHGGLPAGMLPDPEAVAQMPDGDFNQFKSTIFQGGKAMAEMEVAKLKASLEQQQAQAQHGQRMAELEARGKSDQTRLSQQGSLQAQELAGRRELLGQELELVGVKHQNALALEAAKQKANAQGLTAAQVNTERQRMRSQISRLWGYNEFSKLDDDAAQNIEDATLRASRYFEDDGLDFDAAVSRANREIRVEGALKAMPSANPGSFGGNKRQTMEHLQKLMGLGVPKEQVESILTQKGWKGPDVRDIMDRLSLYPNPAEPKPAAAGGGKKFSRTATNPQTGAKVGFDEETQKWVPIR